MYAGILKAGGRVVNSRMINFSSFSSQSLVGKLIRFPLRLIPHNSVVPILQGRLRGKKWVVGSGNHGCWLGSYEYEKQRFFAETIKEGSVVYDIGAHVGFYTLLAAETVGPDGKVIAFEPLPNNIAYLKKHLILNEINNVIVFETAVSEQSGTDTFEEMDSNSEGRLSPKGNLKVKVVALDELILSGEIPPPDYMKIDVEGAELSVLLGSKRMLLRHHPTIFLATHGVEMHKQCCDFLVSTGYHLEPIGLRKDVYNTDEILAYRC